MVSSNDISVLISINKLAEGDVSKSIRGTQIIKESELERMALFNSLKSLIKQGFLEERLTINNILSTGANTAVSITSDGVTLAKRYS